MLANSMQHTLANLSLHDPVLREVPRAAGNIQDVVEASEEWVAVEGGRFEPCQHAEQAYAIYLVSCGAPSPAVAGMKTIRKKQKKVLLQRPVTRSQVRPRVRVQTFRLLY